MFRECLRLLFEETSTIRVSGVAPDAESLEATCRSGPVSAVLFEAAGVPWNVSRLVERLRAVSIDPILVGTYPHEHRHHEKTRGVTYLRRTSPGQAFVRALEGQQAGSALVAESGPEVAERAPDRLTQRELQVLALISGGLTTAQIGQRLGISTKTVENRRQRLFAKLGVQNQSHAVAVAMRTGLLGSGPGHVRNP